LALRLKHGDISAVKLLLMAKPKRPIKLEEHTVSDPAMGYSRPVHLLRGPADQPQRLCLFLDGELYLQQMNVLPVLHALLGLPDQYDPGSRPKASRSPDTSGRAHLHLLADPNSKFKTQNSRWASHSIRLPHLIAAYCQPLPAFPRTKLQPSFLSKTLKTLGKSANSTHQSTTNSQPLPAPWQEVASWPMALPSPAGFSPRLKLR